MSCILIRRYSDHDDIFVASASLLCSSWLRRVSVYLIFIFYDFLIKCLRKDVSNIYYVFEYFGTIII